MSDDVIIKEVEDGIDGAPPWITTFVDMISLLVTFFILLYTFNSMRPYETFAFPKLLTGTRGVMADTKDTMVAPDVDLMLGMDVARGSRKRHTRPVDQLMENLDEMGVALGADQKALDLRSVGDGVRIDFGPGAAFAPGSDRPNAELIEALEVLADAVEHYPIIVLLEGHTASTFSPTREHPDDRSMALTRARHAADVLVRRGRLDPATIQITSLEARFPRVPGAVTANERRPNRRVTARLLAMSVEHQERYEDGRIKERTR